MIDTKLLDEYGAAAVSYVKNDLVFQVEDTPRNYYQIVQGTLKMNNYTSDGKEFIQGLFSDGESFGEPPLLGDFDYPANATVMGPTTVLRLAREQFLKLLSEHPEVHMKFTKRLARRLHYKAMMAAGISTEEADQRILILLDFLKEHVAKVEKDEPYEVELTRQQIADLSGLRVETVIRAMKKLEARSEIRIVNRKVWR